MNKAFTLIELLVVVLIIGILSAIALPQYQRAVIKSRMAELFLNIDKIEQIYEVYKLDPKDWSAEERSNYWDVIYLGEMVERTGIEPAGTISSGGESSCTTSHFIFYAYEDHGDFEFMVQDKDHNFFCRLRGSPPFCDYYTELGKFYISEIQTIYPDIREGSF